MKVGKEPGEGRVDGVGVGFEVWRGEMGLESCKREGDRAGLGAGNECAGGGGRGCLVIINVERVGQVEGEGREEDSDVGINA